MKKFWEYIKQYKIRFCFLGGLFLLFFLLFSLRYITAVSEFWTTTIGRAYQTVIGFLTSLIPISFLELFILATIAYVICWIVFFVIKTKKQGFKTSSVKIVNLLVVLFSVLTIYMGTAGMAYHRKPLELNLRDTSVVAQDEYYSISLWATDKLNECASKLEFDQTGSVKKPYSDKELFKKIKEEYTKINGNYLTKFSANPKQLHIFGWLYTEMNISGVSFLPTGEANYNQYIPNIDLPFVVAHELAHTKGVMGEDEANDLAMYVCLNSDDPYLKYSALANAYNSIEPMAQTINDDEKMNDFFARLDNNVWKDFAYSNDFWAGHTFFKDLSKWFNDLYLEIFGSQNTDAYIDHTDSEVIIVDDEPTFVLNSLSPYQEILIDNWLKENGH